MVSASKLNNHLGSSVDSSPRSTVLASAGRASIKTAAAMNGSGGNEGDATPASVQDGADTAKEESSSTASQATGLKPVAAEAPITGYSYINQPTGYYVGGNEPPSPGAGMTGAVYDTGSFFQTTAGPFHTSAFGAAGNNTPVSPARPMVGIMPPASPLFPRVPMMDASLQGQHPPSPNLSYMTSLPAMYQHYGVGLSSGSSNSQDDVGGWNDRYAT
jgi:hypothetical protein